MGVDQVILLAVSHQLMINHRLVELPVDLAVRVLCFFTWSIEHQTLYDCIWYYGLIFGVRVTEGSPSFLSCSAIFLLLSPSLHLGGSGLPRIEILQLTSLSHLQYEHALDHIHMVSERRNTVFATQTRQIIAKRFGKEILINSFLF